MPFGWDKPPRVIGHRGAAASAPENTLAAFAAAVGEGAGAVELDVRLTRDKRVVVVHDATCGRTVPGDEHVEDLSWAELRARDAGSWFAPAFAGERVPLLADVLRALPAATMLDVELKADAQNAHELPRAVHEEVLAADALDRVLVTSFDPHLATEYARLSGRPAGAITAFEPEEEDFDDWSALAFVALVRDVARGGGLEKLLRAKKRVLVWTVNDAAEAARFLERGAVGIITDRPAQLAAPPIPPGKDAPGG